jgi:hypothetical protein
MAAEGKMPTQTLGPNFHDLLRGRYIAALGTENTDGTIHLTAVWYLFRGWLSVLGGTPDTCYRWIEGGGSQFGC